VTRTPSAQPCTAKSPPPLVVTRWRQVTQSSAWISSWIRPASSKASAAEARSRSCSSSVRASATASGWRSRMRRWPRPGPRSQRQPGRERGRSPAARRSAGYPPRPAAGSGSARSRPAGPAARPGTARNSAGRPPAAATIGARWPRSRRSSQYEVTRLRRLVARPMYSTRPRASANR
jgi:hypothetical protein